MYREIPVQSKICFNQEHLRNIEIHQKKLRSLQSNIDNRKPKQFGFLNKKSQLSPFQVHRNKEINRENIILANKITKISKEGSNDFNFLQQNNSSIMQNSNYGTPFQTMYKNNSQQSMFSTTSIFNSKKSLNMDVRKKDLIQITIENQELMKRINDQKSSLNFKKYDQDRNEIERLINNISTFKYKDFQPTQTILPENAWTLPKNQKLDPIPFEKFRPTQSRNRIIFRKVMRKQNDVAYFVEVKIEDGLFIITVENLQTRKFNTTMQLNQQEGMYIFKNECSGIPELFMKRIRIDEALDKFTLIRFEEEIKEYEEDQNFNNSEQGGQPISNLHQNANEDALKPKIEINNQTSEDYQKQKNQKQNGEQSGNVSVLHQNEDQQITSDMEEKGEKSKKKPIYQHNNEENRLSGHQDGEILSEDNQAVEEFNN